MEHKNHKKATNAFKETLRSNPRYAAAWKAIGNIFFDNDSSTSATKYY